MGRPRTLFYIPSVWHSIWIILISITICWILLTQCQGTGVKSFEIWLHLSFNRVWPLEESFRPLYRTLSPSSKRRKKHSYKWSNYRIVSNPWSWSSLSLSSIFLESCPFTPPKWQLVVVTLWLEEGDVAVFPGLLGSASHHQWGRRRVRLTEWSTELLGQQILNTPNLPPLSQCRCWNSPCEISSSPFLCSGSTNTHEALEPWECANASENVKLAQRRKGLSSFYIYGLSFLLT